MSILRVSVAPTGNAKVPPDVGPFFVDAVYTRTVTAASAEGSDRPTTIQDTARATLDNQLRGVISLADVAPSSTIELHFLRGNGGVRFSKTVAAGSGDALSVHLSADDIKAIAAEDPKPEPSTPLISRRAYFVTVGEQAVPFASSRLQIAPIRVAAGGWKKLGLDKTFNSDSPITTAVPWNPALLAEAAAIPWTDFHLAVDGQFTFDVPLKSGDAWMWWLSGPLPAIGVVLDDLSVPRVPRIGVALPPFTGAAPVDEGPGRVPTDVTETEVVDNPQIYTEDPGAFCQPFKNPERVLGERSFSVIFRAEQPVISAEASVRKDPLHVLTSVLSAMTPGAAPAAIARTVTAPTPVTAGALLESDTNSAFVRVPLPGAYTDVVSTYNRGRTEMNAAQPVQWESDSSRYQATTVARGHIIEFRMRWRSNGYSLGTVAKTLTLAPRQIRRIEKIEWRRSELSRRQETTRLADQVSDTLLRERDYDDSVQANLSEWARGESESNMVAGAGGFGFVVPPFVVGGGGGGSHASSSSSQQGGRRTTANEEQRLRDSIRRYGDSLRKLDSLVVNEVTQEETATGTTEVVRNANYGHSLTVIYYQILRHLKVEMGVAGVRECLFVPFAITPFTVARAFRWRESIQRGLRDPQYSGAIRYLKDVLTGFATSDVPPGRRADQPVRFIHGSLFISLAIDRPRDTDEGAFDPARWALVQPYLGVPALGIFNQLKAVVEAQRDALFQKQQAPVIAANWVNTLQLDLGGVPLPADFTLATRYQFNGVVRVDFSVPVPAAMNVTRAMLSALRLSATKDLTPGSVANLQRFSFTYQTDRFQRAVAGSIGSDDLIDVQSGVRDPSGASMATFPDEWELRDVRAEMIAAVQNLVEHLNEHVEYYHKCIWWNMDRDRLFMLIDGFYVPGTNQISIASVVEREPIAIIGNAIVFRVSAGSFLGIGDIKTPQDLYNYYVSHQAPSEPMLISLPTDGLYAQTVMDECPALEEHFGNTDWVLNDPDPALTEIAPELLASRRAEPQATTPTPLPQTLINLQNAPEAPAPSGLAGALAAVTTPNAFRDMAGLAGTQANAAAAFQTAANLAQNFGNQAAALKLAEIADKAHATQTADQKLATVQRAVDKNLTTPEDAQLHTSQILQDLHTSPTSETAQREAATQAMNAVAGKPGSTVEYQDALGATKVAFADGGGGGGGGSGGGVGGGGPGTVAVVDPFPVANAIPFSALDPALVTCIDTASNVANVKDLCTGVIDLTGLGANPGTLPYQGHNDSERLYVGSIAKIYPLLAAFELRQRVTLQATAMILLHGLNTSTAGWQTKVFDTIQKAWQPQLDAKFPTLPKGRHPNFAAILDIAPDGTASFRNQFTDWIKLATQNNDEAAAGKYIRALSYPYINGVLEGAGFFDSMTNTGLWISGDYNGNDWLDNDKAGKPIDPKWQKPGHKVSNFVGTAKQLTRYVGLIATGNLATSASSVDIEALLGRPWLDDILTNATPSRDHTSAVGKVGIGTWDLRDHDAGILTWERDPTDATKTIRYVVVVLGSDRQNTQMAQLELAYHDCIVAQHP